MTKLILEIAEYNGKMYEVCLINTEIQMKQFRRIISLAAVLCLLFVMVPQASALDSSGDYFKDRSWDDVVADLFAEYGIDHDRIALGYYNTVTGEEHFYQPDKYMLGASIYKVPLNMAFAEKIYNGEFDWDTPMPYYPYEYMMRESIINSNNDLSGSLMFTLGGSYQGFLNYIAQYLGVDTETVDPQYYNERYTARQYVTCLKTLYHESERFPKIIDTMKEAEPDNYFALHEDRYEIAHKYGYWQEDWLLHMNDVGIVYTDDPIVIVMFTAGVANAYELMADYCTLMCDYTNYHRAERLSAEAEAEAEVRRITAEAAEAAKELTESTSLIGSPNEPTKELPSAKSRTAIGISPLLIFLAIVIGTALALVAVIRCSRKYKMNVLWGSLAVALSSLAALLCLLASSAGILIAKPQGDPQQSVTGFFDSLAAEDYATAYSYLSAYSSLGLENTPSDEVGKMIYKALRESYSYELYGQCNVNKLSANQQLQFTYLDLSAMQADVQAALTQKLEEIVMARPKAEVYDENNKYLPEVTGDAYAAAVEEVLKSAGKYYVTTGIQLQLEYEDGRWLIIPDQALLKALMGGIAY